MIDLVMEFVTFELAIKLRERGFKEKCLAYYDVEDNVGLLYNTQYTDEILPCQYEDLLQCHNTGEAEVQPDDSDYCVDAPTISQVLKWLREEKNIHIEIRLFTCGYGFDIYKIYPKEKIVWSGTLEHETFEQAAIAGLEYTLYNLF